MKTSIEVDASRLEGVIDRNVYGHFIENMARCIYGGLLRNEEPGRVRGPWRLRDDLVRMVKELAPPVLRWPGGLYADGYCWRDGVGPRGARPVRRNRYWSRYGPLTRVLDPNRFGSDEFMELSRGLGAEPYVNVNLGTGSAVEAARWVEYMNGTEETLEGGRRAEYGHPKPWGVRYWGIGNEMYGIWSLGHSKPEEYAKRYLEFRGAMEEVNQGLSYVAVGAEQYFSKTWNRAVLTEVGDKAELLSIHIYLPGPERLAGVLASRAVRGTPGMFKAIVASCHEYERRLEIAQQDIKSVMGEGSGVGIALDEWNLWWSPSQLLVPRWTLRDALYVCGMFHVMHRLPYIKMANIAQLVNVLGVLSASGDRVYRSTLYYPFLMYGRLAGPLRLATRVSGESFDSPRVGGIPAMREVGVLDCSATMDADRSAMTVFVINRHISDDVEAKIEISGFSPKKEAEVHCLSGPGVNAFNWYGRDEVVGVKRSDIDSGDVLPRYRFPAHSATAIRFRG